MLLEEARRHSSNYHQNTNSHQSISVMPQRNIARRNGFDTLERQVSNRKKVISLNARNSSQISKQSIVEKARDVVMRNRGGQNDSVTSLSSSDQQETLTIDYQPYNDQKQQSKPLRQSSSLEAKSKLAAVKLTYGSSSTKANRRLKSPHQRTSMELPPLNQRSITIEDVIIEAMDETMTDQWRNKQHQTKPIQPQRVSEHTIATLSK